MFTRLHKSVAVDCHNAGTSGYDGSLLSTSLCALLCSADGMHLKVPSVPGTPSQVSIQVFIRTHHLYDILSHLLIVTAMHAWFL
jgi:hypothetical protein